VLWEHFPAEVMDLALKLHHTAIRSALAANMGYESATEGDSFIVAFHTADNALRFCLDAQTRLLEAAWPEELLQGHEESRPVLMSTAQ
jgi:class 3 adenylate cyclase